MNSLPIIIMSNIKNNWRAKIPVIVYVTLTLMFILALFILLHFIFIRPQLKMANPDISQLMHYFGIIIFTTSLICIGLNSNVYFFEPLAREKTQGCIEALLATPIKLKELWLGKCLAIFLPGLVIGEVISILTLFILINFYKISGGEFIITSGLIINGFMIIPAIYFSLTLLASLIGLVGRPTFGNLILQIFFSAYASLSLNLLFVSPVKVYSLTFTIINLVLIGLIVLVIFILISRLKIEQVVLSKNR